MWTGTDKKMRHGKKIIGWCVCGCVWKEVGRGEEGAGFPLVNQLLITSCSMETDGR